jgi:two-component system response regulator RegA
VTSTNPSLLLVDDDEVFLNRLARACGDRGYDVRTATDGDAALRAAREDSPELAVVDLRMVGISGLDVVEQLKEIDPSTRVVMLTGYGSVPTAIEAMRLGATHYLQKPVTADDVLAAFEPKGQAKAALKSAPSSKDSKESKEGDAAIPSLARAEWEYIHRVLDDCEGNLSEAARRLQIHRRSLQRKLQKLPPRA